MRRLGLCIALLLAAALPAQRRAQAAPPGAPPPVAPAPAPAPAVTPAPSPAVPAAPASSARGPDDAKTVTWYQMDFPPIYILSGPYRAQQMHGGVDEGIQAALEAQGYKVQFRTANQERIIHEMRSGERVCCSALVRNETLEDQLEYSIAHSLALAGAAVIDKRSLERFKPFLDADGKLVLERLVVDSHFTLGIASSRNYGGAVDVLLSRQPATAKHIFRRTGLDIGSGLLRMLAGGRIDYTLMFPWEAMYIARTMEREDQIMTLPLAGMPEYVLGVAACPKNAWGKQVIALVNGAVREFRNTPEYHRRKEFWLDEASKQRYRKYVEEFYGQEQPDR